MPKITRSLLPTILIAALCLPAVAFAQTEPGSLDLLGADFEPLQTQTAQAIPELNAPIIMGPTFRENQESIPQLDSVLEPPRVTIDEPAPGALLLPDLTIPTPENTAMDSFENRRSLKPQLGVQPPDPIELLPFDNGDVAELRPQSRATLAQPRMQSPQMQSPQMRSPQALNYGSRTYSSRSRLQVVPIQVEFYSVSRGFGYQSYGGYRGGLGFGYNTGYPASYGRPPVGFRPYGGYVPYGGFGRGNGGGAYCPSRR